VNTCEFFWILCISFYDGNIVNISHLLKCCLAYNVVSLTSAYILYRYTKTHGGYSEDDLNIELTHVSPVSFSDKTALFAVRCVRLVFDTGECVMCVCLSYVDMYARRTD